jgi:hypothetical protein
VLGNWRKWGMFFVERERERERERESSVQEKWVAGASQPSYQRFGVCSSIGSSFLCCCCCWFGEGDVTLFYCLCVCVCVCVFVAIVKGERTGVLISCLLAVLSVVAEEGVWGGEGGRGTWSSSRLLASPERWR